MAYLLFSWYYPNRVLVHHSPKPTLFTVSSAYQASDTGENLCYYNYKCAVPFNTVMCANFIYLPLCSDLYVTKLPFFLNSAFNNVWSNIGYVILGITFIIIVLIKLVAVVINQLYQNLGGMIFFFQTTVYEIKAKVWVLVCSVMQ